LKFGSEYALALDASIQFTWLVWVSVDFQGCHFFCIPLSQETDGDAGGRFALPRAKSQKWRGSMWTWLDPHKLEGEYQAYQEVVWTNLNRRTIHHD
jgi:hypothetical protein